MDQQSKTDKELSKIGQNYEFADLSANALEEINQTQKQLSQNGKEIILLAYEKK